MNTHIRSPWKCLAGLAFALALMAPAAMADEASDTLNIGTNPYTPKSNPRSASQVISIGYFRPHDARGINMFEAPKREGAPHDGFKIQWGAAFTQQFQSLTHENTAVPVISGNPPVNVNQLIVIGKGFNNAEANLFMDTQLARGVRVALTSYLSSRHHNETWVKDGYLLIDGSPWENEKLDKLFQHLTLRLGHFEINYGDQHFRRSDNGSAMFNPLVGNFLMDAFTTEIGGEAYWRQNGFLGMFAMTGGEVHGQVIKPENRSPSIIGKLGYDKTYSPGTRVRLTGSIYTTDKSNSNSLYSGSRSGSRYYFVLENLNATESAQAWSGDVQPGMSHKITAWVVNPFVTWNGLEVFGNIEKAKGRNAVETTDRHFDQLAVDGVYRFMNRQLYVAGRWNQAKGRFASTPSEVKIERVEGGGGWFLTQTLEAKVEYIDQKYKDFPVTDIRNGGHFKGAMVEAVVSF